ncbi:hypothetical protein SAMN05421548_14217 [Paraburkholderia lycopersici]|uniref:N-acetyltransferase domain-containing protein n=2 Tax=Paraburkholderia lycopersici TaxID=416944 RepID=A0A1G7C015_9BURK|nr:hypothetical protein SAMN05421548_14217 [Paraburkholderia lycopersici]
MKDISTIAVVRRENACTLDARVLLDEMSATLALYCAPTPSSLFDAEDLCTVRSAFVVARTTDGFAIGCGALCRFSFEVAEFRCLYRRPEWPGTGAAILQFLEAIAIGAGYRRAILQAREANRRAIAFCRRHGYERAEPFADCAGASDVRCFVKALPLVAGQ